jgi:CRP-like cAMP-binding protein
VISGECSVERERAENDRITLNTLGKYSSFGIMSVLSGKDEYPTVIRAVRTSEILFIDGDDMLSIIKKYPTVAMNVMRFLADRVSFLNEKINTLSEKSTLSRLANHLLKQYRALGEVLTVSKSKLATQIDVGRASLYRDLDTLCEMKLIEVESKRIIINDPKGLERIIK